MIFFNKLKLSHIIKLLKASVCLLAGHISEAVKAAIFSLKTLVFLYFIPTCGDFLPAHFYCYFFSSLSFLSLYFFEYSCIDSHMQQPPGRFRCHPQYLSEIRKHRLENIRFLCFFFYFSCIFFNDDAADPFGRLLPTALS